MPWKLIYYEACLNENDAKRREKYLKTSTGRRMFRRRIIEYIKNESKISTNLKTHFRVRLFTICVKIYLCKAKLKSVKTAKKISSSSRTILAFMKK